MNPWNNNLRITIPKRRVFYSFHYKNDCWRTQQIRNIGTLDGNKPVSPNEWEKIKSTGETDVKEWIDRQLNGRTCTVVLVGSQTASRPFIQYEIKRSWDLGLGVFGIYIDELKDQNGNISFRGDNPFRYVKINGMRNPGSVIDIYDYDDADYRFMYNSFYKYIVDNISDWIERAIQKRKNWR